MRRPVRHRARPRSKRRILGWMVVLIILASLMLVNFVLLYPFSGPIRLREQLDAARQSSIVFDREGRIVTTLNPSHIIWQPLSVIPLALRQTVVAVEDARFYSHRGIDIRGILRAVFENILHGRQVQGGSTITQQLAKNILLTQEKTFRRKLAEINYAVRIEDQYNKSQILEMYLNDIYFGQGAYGVEAAAQTYFGRSVRDLSLDQIALLAGLPKGPEYYSPFTHPQRALERRNTVLAVMKDHGIIDSSRRQELNARPLGTLPQPGVPTRGSYFADYVVAELVREYGWSERYIHSGGLKIHTTLDLRMQQIAEESLAALPTEAGNEARPQAALVAIDPLSGEIRAMVGGRSYRQSPLNRAADVRRQPGSAIKPVVYAAALMNGYQASTIVEDSPVSFTINDTTWEPQNNDGQYRGRITLSKALAESVNTIAVKLVNQIGVDKVFQLAQQLGIPLVEKGERNDRALAPLALGGLTQGVTPLEMASSYTAFANGGIRSEPVAVLYIEDSTGRLLRRGRYNQQRVLPLNISAELTRMMEGVLLEGTGTRGYPGRPAAGKTGTSSGNSNAWFVGYTPELLAAVWLGNDDNAPLKAGVQIIGSGTAAECWGKFILHSLAGRPPKDFSFLYASSYIDPQTGPRNSRRHTATGNKPINKP